MESNLCFCERESLSFLYSKNTNGNNIISKIEKCPIIENTLDSKLENFEPSGNENCEYSEETELLIIPIKTPLTIPTTPTTPTSDNPNSNPKTITPTYNDKNYYNSTLAYYIAERKYSTLIQLQKILPKNSEESIDEYIDRFKEFNMD